MDDPTYLLFSEIDERRASPKTIERYRELVVPRAVPMDGIPAEVEVYGLTP